MSLDGAPASRRRFLLDPYASGRGGASPLVLVASGALRESVQNWPSRVLHTALPGVRAPCLVLYRVPVSPPSLPRDEGAVAPLKIHPRAWPRAVSITARATFPSGGPQPRSWRSFALSAFLPLPPPPPSTGRRQRLHRVPGADVLLSFGNELLFTMCQVCVTHVCGDTR